MRAPRLRRALVLAALLASVGPALAQVDAARADAPRRSSFGEYTGYSEPIYDEWVTTSLYVEMRDGVKLAVDITRPAVNGRAVDEPLPVVWTHSRYHRNVFSALGRAELESMVDGQPSLQRLVRHGYVLAAACVRGGGASFGRFEGLFSENETSDAVELIEWFAAQPWCDGNVGMYGGSYLGITQYMAASRAPEALKAIVPDVAAFDMYDLIYAGGVFRDDMLRHWAGLTNALDNQIPAEPVDADADGSLLAAARAQHAHNWPVMDGYASAPFRDSTSELHEWSHHGPSAFLAEINASKIPIYHLNGWFDVFAFDTTLWFANYEGPQRMMMGDWSHAQSTNDRQRLTDIEQLRWFDRWLKGIENGVEDEPPVRYQLMIEPGESEWIAAESWPPAGTDTLELFLGTGPSGSVESVNDGALSASAGAAARDRYRVDPTTTTGTSTRWDQAVGAAPVMRYSGLAANDAKCLTYTTAPLEEDLTVIGHPVVRLFVASSSGDADLHVLLEEVADGDLRYVTEGVLRASLRKLGEAPYDNLGLPYQRCFAEDAEPLPADAPAEVLMDLLPTATVFDAGHRLRLTIMGADADNTRPGPKAEETTLSLFHGGEHASRIALPVLR